MREYWQIRGFDGDKQFYEREVPIAYFSHDQVKGLLRCLASRAGLSFDEIMRACANRQTKIANDLLKVQRDGPSPSFMCGENPYFVVCIVRLDS